MKRSRSRSIADAEVKIRKGKNPQVEFQITHEYGMRYPRAVYRPDGQSITSPPPHGLSVKSAAEWVCLLDHALAKVDIGADRDAAYRATRAADDCFRRVESCPVELRKCVKRW